MDSRITKAQRIQQPALIALWGASSSGKTYSALQLAHGLVGNSQLIGMIDTENRRGLAHVGIIPGDYYHFDLTPPFTVERYIDAFKAFEHDPQFGCVIIDSYTHVWDGEGGATEQASKSTKKGLGVWFSPKTDVKRLINVLLRSRMHVILCMREKMSCGQDHNGPNGQMRVFDTGYVPITEKNTIFEMGVSFWLGMDHKPIYSRPSEKVFAHERIPMVKAPPAIMRHLKEGEYLSVRHGQLIAEWYRGDTRDLVAEGKMAASRGTDSLKAWSATLTEMQRSELTAKNLGLKAIAAQADADEANRLAGVPQQSDADDPAENPYLQDNVAPEQTNQQPQQPATNGVMALDQYEAMLHCFDWTWQMSDAPGSHQKGTKAQNEIETIARLSPQHLDLFWRMREQAGGLNGAVGFATPRLDKPAGVQATHPPATPAPTPAPTNPPTTPAPTRKPEKPTSAPAQHSATTQTVSKPPATQVPQQQAKTTTGNGNIW
ncbi:AAA family ATPase [Candidatus Magnetaquicoccus inordinatus]|uniref:AAA family ATPase n=1 Tax=Candidatus Magnetaquicoccus inordinatus TaxID=2496818 RepID=UPI00187D605D|nr:AAA family ATPase [Candidatus Magnetaquicoccus inordinatus]